jgi:hypothetical protein
VDVGGCAAAEAALAAVLVWNHIVRAALQVLALTRAGTKVAPVAAAGFAAAGTGTRAA